MVWGINRGGKSGQGGKGGSRGRGVGDADEGGDGGRGNERDVTRLLLPAEVLEVLVRLGTTPAWACCARRWWSCSACNPAAKARWVVSAPVARGSGGHVPHATGQLVRAMEYEAHVEGCAEKKEHGRGAPLESKAPLFTSSAQN